MRKYLLGGLLLVCMVAYGASRIGNITIDDTTIGNVSSTGSITLDPGSGGLIFNDLTATTVPYLNGSKALTSSAVTPTELGLLSGVTALLTDAGTATLTNKTIDADGTGNSITNIENADIKASAAIAVDKLAATTASRALVSDGSGFLSAATTTATEIGYVNGVTSAIQTQIDGLLPDFTGSADNILLRTDGTGGDAIQESGITVDDSDNVSGIGIMELNGTGSTPSNPSSGDVKLYAKSGDENLYFLKSNGVETQLGGGGSGVGGITYWSDYQAETTSNVSEDADYPTYVGTPDAGALQLTISSETTNPLSGTTSYSLTKSAADASDQAWVFELDTPDRLETVAGQTVYVTFNYETDANYDNDSSGEQFSVFYWADDSTTNPVACSARDTLSGTFTNAIPVAPNGGQFQCALTMNSADGVLHFLIGVTGTGTSSSSLIVDRIKVGPDATVTAPIVTEWTPYTMTINGSSSDPTKATTPTADSAQWRRVGDSMEIQYFYRGPNPATGSAAGSGSYQFNIPTGYTIDSSKIEITSSAGVNGVGSAIVYDGVGSPSQTGTTAIVSSTKFLIIVGDNTQADNVIGSAYIPITNANVYYSFTASVPITEFANSNAILSTTQADHQTIKVHANNSAGESLTADTTDINFENETIDTHNAWDGDQFTAPAAGTYSFEGLIRMTANAQRAISSYKDGTIYQAVSTNAYNGILSKFSGSVYLDKGEILSFRSDVTESVASGVASNNWITIESNPDFSTFSVYGAYEVVSGTGAIGTYSVTAGQWGDFTSFSLTPGTWDCWANSYWNSNGATTTRNILMGFGTTSGNNSPGTAGSDYFGEKKSNTSAHIDQVYFRKSDITVTETTTYYLKSLAETSITNLDAGYTYVCKRDK